RVERCVYVESGTRCRRSGTGEPSLCNPHRVALADIARQSPPMPGFSGVRNLVDRFVNGRKVTRKVWEDAIGDLAAAVASGIGDTQMPPSGDPFADADIDPNFPPWRRRVWTNLGAQQQQQRRPPPPPPVDPAIEERRKARIVMGFTPGQALTLEMVQKRRRELARKHHPDRGGSVDKMQAVNAAADVLEAAISQR
ncbi:MAG TPA: hypothetical protein VFO62_00955, partial [Candidatus Binatia bacterium]|nr:hypothetical protein [Candidatus Binatia bacterium]